MPLVRRKRVHLKIFPFGAESEAPLIFLMRRKRWKEWSFAKMQTYKRSDNMTHTDPPHFTYKFSRFTLDFPLI